MQPHLNKPAFHKQKDGLLFEVKSFKHLIYKTVTTCIIEIWTRCIFLYIFDTYMFTRWIIVKCKLSIENVFIIVYCRSCWIFTSLCHQNSIYSCWIKTNIFLTQVFFLVCQFDVALIEQRLKGKQQDTKRIAIKQFPFNTITNNYYQQNLLSRPWKFIISESSL